MPEPHRPVLGSLALIAIVIGAGAAAFAYTAGWFSHQRLTPTKLVDALAPSAGPSLGHRRNHAKGICFTGEFEANGAGSERALQSCYRRCERAGCDGPRARIGNTDRDARRPGMA